MKTGLFCILFAVSPVFFYACSTLSERAVGPCIDPHSPGRSCEIQELLSVLEKRNSALRAFKAVGRLTLWQKGAIETRQRAAWIGAAPGNLRMVILASGRPVVKLASNGKWLYYHDLHRSPSVFKKIRVTNGRLKRLVPVPIRADDLLSLLAGRIPVHSYHSARLIRRSANGDDVLVLRKWWRTCERIYFAKDTTIPRRVEVFDLGGSLLYRAHLDRIQGIDGFDIPMDLTISDGENQAGIRLVVDRYWPNISVTESMFALTPPA